MSSRSFLKVVTLGLIVAVSMLARPAESRAQVVDPGYDLFQTTGGSASGDPTNPLSSLIGVPLGTYDFGGSIGVQNTGLTDTIIQRLDTVSSPAGTTGLVVDALQLQSTVNPSVYVTLDPTQASTGSMVITFTSPTSGTFDSTLNVFYDVRFGSVAGPIVAQGEETFAATAVAWDRTPPTGAVAIAGANYLLNGVDTSADFWPSPFTELNPTAFHAVTVAGYSVPEPSTWIMLATGLMVPAYVSCRRRRRS
jgi:PEP-CTERM motif